MERAMGQAVAHQLARAEGIPDSTPGDEGPAAGQSGLLLSGQLDSGRLSPQAGRHSLLGSPASSDQDLQVGETITNHVDPETHRGTTEDLADLASREVLPAEWRLTDHAWKWLLTNSPFSAPTLDLFGSPCENPQAVVVEAISSQWPQEVIYAFPPSYIVAPFLLRLQREKTYRVALVVSWSSQAKWMPQLASLQVKANLAVPVDRPLLGQPHWDHKQMPPSLANLRLIFIWRVAEVTRFV